MAPTPPSDELEFGPAVVRSVSDGEPVGGTRVTVELGVRALSPEGQPLLDRAVCELRTAVEAGAVSGFDVIVFGDGFDPTTLAAGTAAGQAIARRISEIRRWADELGVRVDPYFREEDVDCLLSGEHYCRVQFPSLTLVEYHDDELSFVAPVEVDGERIEPLDRLRTLARSTPDAAPEPPIAE
jgi:hypothetical protein